VTRRDEQRAATARRIVEAAVECLVAKGFAATSTVEVQNRAGVSRGALLHHFPTREQLFAAAVHRLVELNLEAMREELAGAPPGLDPVARGIWVMRRASTRPTFGTELELWGASRADPNLHAALRVAEQAVRKDLYRMIDEIFGTEISRAANYQVLVELSVQLVRGLSITSLLYRGDPGPEPLIEVWTRVARLVLAQEPMSDQPERPRSAS
jgi:AcrR family transcriptional regulator